MIRLTDAEERFVADGIRLRDAMRADPSALPWGAPNNAENAYAEWCANYNNVTVLLSVIERLRSA